MCLILYTLYIRYIVSMINVIIIYVTYANGLQMSAIWGACTLALDIFVAVTVVVACDGTARETREEKQEIRKKLNKNN